MSAEFDTVDHQILFERPVKHFGFAKMPSDGLVSIYRDARSLSCYLTPVHSCLRLHIEYHRALFWNRVCLYSIRVSWKALYIAMDSHLTATEMIASCSLSADQMSRTISRQLLSAASSMSLTECHATDLKLNPTKTEFLSSHKQMATSH